MRTARRVLLSSRRCLPLKNGWFWGNSLITSTTNAVGIRANSDFPDIDSGRHAQSPMADLTQILRAVERGEENSSERLLPLVYEELRRLAAIKMSHEAEHQTLQPTALVHEAWLRLTTGEEMGWQNRGHFFGAAA